MLLLQSSQHDDIKNNEKTLKKVLTEMQDK